MIGVEGIMGVSYNSMLYEVDIMSTTLGANGSHLPTLSFRNSHVQLLI